MTPELIRRTGREDKGQRRWAAHSDNENYSIEEKLGL